MPPFEKRPHVRRLGVPRPKGPGGEGVLFGQKHAEHSGGFTVLRWSCWELLIEVPPKVSMDLG